MATDNLQMETGLNEQSHSAFGRINASPAGIREALDNELSRRAPSLDLSLINILIADRA